MHGLDPARKKEIVVAAFRLPILSTARMVIAQSSGQLVQHRLKRQQRKMVSAQASGQLAQHTTDG